MTGNQISGIKVLEQHPFSPFTKDKINSSIPACFGDQVLQTPERLAIKTKQFELTYGELDRWTNGIAEALLAMTSSESQPIGLLLEHDAPMIAAILGVLKAGHFYVPIDPAYPLERVKHILKDCGARFIFTNREQLSMVDSLLEPGQNAIVLDQNVEFLNETPRAVISPDDFAYIIYTSGSTGQPKGIVNTHRNLLHQVMTYTNSIHLNQDDRHSVLQKCNYSRTLKEVFAPLLNGASLFMFNLRVEGVNRLAEWLIQEGITVMGSVVSAFRSFTSVIPAGMEFPNLRIIYVGGEALYRSDALMFFEKFYPSCVLMHGIGATETGTFLRNTLDRLTDLDSDRIPVGTPLVDMGVSLLNKNGDQVSPGEIGEMVVRSQYLAKGYWNKPKLTEKVFIDESNRDDNRSYHTGDLGRFRVDGLYEHLGRKDTQVKIRGNRIEISEIEAVLVNHLAVKDAVVLATDPSEREKRLVAYVALSPMFVPKVGGHSRYKLPNGMEIAHKNIYETNYLYKEHFEKETYIKHGISLRPGSCIFDVGANIGIFSLSVANSCNDVRIYAFEPIPPIFDLLQINSAIFEEKIKPYQIGLSNRNDIAEFTYYPHQSVMSGMSSLVDIKMDATVLGRHIRQDLQSDNAALSKLDSAVDAIVESRFESESFYCDLKMLSEVIREEKIDHIDLLKIDVQRAELEVLQGVEPDDWMKIDQIVMETHDALGSESEGRVRNLKDFLEQWGFRFHVVQDQIRHDTDRYLIYATRNNLRNQAETKHKIKLPADSSKYENKKAISSLDLIEYLSEKFPSYMVPLKFVFLDSLPISPNGKIDLKALPEPDWSRPELETDYTVPYTPVEKMLVDVWSDILGFEVGINDNFFDLGGDSLSAVNLLVQIEKRMGIQFRLSVLFDAPTIQKLAESITKNNWKSRWECLVPVQPLGSKPSLFLVPPAASSGMRFAPLAKHLGSSQPVYGFTPIGFDNIREPHRDVEEMAKLYIREMRMVQPQGPYQIGGMCFGGLVAFEMAHQLTEQGQIVSQLMLLDAPYPLNRPNSEQPPRNFAHVIDRVKFHLGNRSLISMIRTKLKEYFSPYIEAICWRVPKEHTPQDRIQYTQFCHSLAQENYFTNTYQGNAALIQTEQHHQYGFHVKWDELILDEFSYCFLPGTRHGSLLDEGSNVQFVAKQIEEYLNRAEI